MRTRLLDTGFWIDEGLSVGIADRSVLDIPGVLRQDGSPPLYYMLLGLWLPLAGDSEAATHALSLLFAALCVPVAWWGGRLLFGARTGWMAAVLAAANPFLTQYAQETRMYALMVLLGLVALVCWLRAFAADPPEDGSVRRGAAARLRGGPRGDALHAQLGRVPRPGDRRGRARAARARAAARAPRACCARRCRPTASRSLLYLPWLPTLLYQVAHTGAPWSQAPDLADLASTPARLLGETAEIALVLAAGAGLVAIVRQRARGRLTAARPRRRCALALIGVLTVLVAWLSSQLTPAWATRYLAARCAPFLLLAAAGLAHAGRLGIAGAGARRRAVGGRGRAAGGEEQRARRRRGRRALAAARRPRGDHLARAGAGARATTCRRACATRR